MSVMNSDVARIRFLRSGSRLDELASDDARAEEDGVGVFGNGDRGSSPNVWLLSGSIKAGSDQLEMRQWSRHQNYPTFCITRY